MLDNETLKALYDLTAKTLYHAEVVRIPQPSREEEQRLVESARTGDAEARKTLIVSNLGYVLSKAHSTYDLRSLSHDDVLDLVQVGNLAMVENTGRALVRDNPVSYLRGIARRAIDLYCSYRASMIRKPENLRREEYEKYRQRGPLLVESLDAPLTSDTTFTRMELATSPIGDPATVVENESTLEELQAQYPDLYQALDTLPPHLREVVTLRYGLDGESPMRQDMIGKRSNVYYQERRALFLLQEQLLSAARTRPFPLEEIPRWNPMTDVPHERGYVEIRYGHYVVMRDGQHASNWQGLEPAVRQSIVPPSQGESQTLFYPLTWDLLKKAEFPPQQDKELETYLVGDGEGRFFIRHLEQGKPTDDWREVQTYIVYDQEESRYMVENKDGPARNWQELEPEARAAIEQANEEVRVRRVIECPPELAEKAVFLPTGELEPDLAPLPWEEAQAMPQEQDITPDFDR